MVRHWNWFPTVFLGSLSLEVFKTQLDVAVGNLLYPAWEAWGGHDGCGQTKFPEAVSTSTVV